MKNIPGTSRTPLSLHLHKAVLPLATLLLCSALHARADQYHGNGNTGFGGAIGNGMLTLTDDGTNISGALTVGGSMNDVLVLYLQTGPGGFTNTAGFNDQGDGCRCAISGASASGRSLLTFASGFQPNYVIALAPAAVGTGGLYQLANGGNNSLVYLTNVNLAPLNSSGPYSFSFPAGLIGMIPGVRSTIQVFGTYIRTDGSRSTEATAGNLTGTQGWNAFTQTAYAGYTFDAGSVLIKLPGGAWVRQSDSSPAARYGHTAVWTGSEMVIWGGFNGSGYFNDGARYNPVANVWTAMPGSGAFPARAGHTAVWTGTEMIVWGGVSNSTFYATGRRYNLVANTWTSVATTGAPVARYAHTAVWTGSEMIVWGGSNGSGYLSDGGRYNPTANSWTALPSSGAPSSRDSHTALWTGSEMIVWGGESGGCLGDGGRYDPAANSWTGVATSGAPTARCQHTAVWTGSEMIIWGGNPTVMGSYCLSDGGRYNPAANTWTTMPTSGAPGPRYGHTAVWTGSNMAVWGGYYANGPTTVCLADGRRYDPVANSWTVLGASGAPAARYRHTAVWTGTEMIVWGGSGSTGALSDGGRYDPAADSWTAAVPAITAAVARALHTAVWTGSEMIVWGGTSGSSYLNTGGRYNPAGNSWATLPTMGAPGARYYHTAVWTGVEMIVWGGYNGSAYLNDGGRYHLAANSWTAVPSTGGPSVRDQHTAVWTGIAMIVIGGYCNGMYVFPFDTWSYYPYAPAVRFVCSSPATADVAWPVWHPSLSLCSTTNLASGQWTTVTDAVTQVGAENHVTVSPLSGRQFFRAEYP